MNSQKVTYLKIENGVVWATYLEKPAEPNYLKFYTTKREQEKYLKDHYDSDHVAIETFNNSWVEVSNYDVAVDWFMKHRPNDTWSDRGGNEIKDGIYPIEGFVMEVSQVMTDGWVPTYNDPDNAGLHENAELITVCTLSLAPVVGEALEKKSCQWNCVKDHCLSFDADYDERKCKYNAKPESLKEGEEKKDRDWVDEQMEKFRAFLDSCPKDKLDAMIKECDGVGSNGPTVDEYFAGLGGQFTPEPKEERTPDQMPDFNEWIKSESGISCTGWPITEPKYLHNRLFWAFDAGRDRMWDQYMKQKQQAQSLESELKNLREENERLNNGIDLAEMKARFTTVLMLEAACGRMKILSGSKWIEVDEYRQTLAEKLGLNSKAVRP